LQGFDPVYGDRQQELVFIGIKMDHEKIKQVMTKCLLTDDELEQGPEAWKSYPDPFGVWKLDEPHKHEHEDGDEDDEDEDDEDEDGENEDEEDEDEEDEDGVEDEDKGEEENA